jgi:glycosyltransferase involved in cell wall biosynthesis
LSRVCLFLSHIEGWGFVPLEALSVGLPVVVYDLACYAESLDGLVGVSRVPIGDVEAAAAQVVNLLSMPTGEYMTMSTEIESKFHYADWTQVASAELALVLGTRASRVEAPQAG